MIKVNSKKRIDNNRGYKKDQANRKVPKFGFEDSDNEEKKETAFVPHMFANKNNNKDKKKESPKNSIGKMFAKAPIAKAKPNKKINWT